MRKVGADDDEVSVIEIASAFGGNIAYEGRILVKLH